MKKIIILGSLCLGLVACQTTANLNSNSSQMMKNRCMQFGGTESYCSLASRKFSSNGGNWELAKSDAKRELSGGKS